MQEVAGSNPVVPTERDRKPFGEHVEGLSHLGTQTCAVEPAVQTDDFEHWRFAEIGGKPFLFQCLREFKHFLRPTAFSERLRSHASTSRAQAQRCGPAVPCSWPRTSIPRSPPATANSAAGLAAGVATLIDGSSRRRVPDRSAAIRELRPGQDVQEPISDLLVFDFQPVEKREDLLVEVLFTNA